MNIFGKKQETPVITDEELNEDPDANRLMGTLAVDVLKPLVNITLEGMSATGRWLLASLLTINAGGMAAILSAHDAFESHGLTLSGTSFLIGMVLAILLGLAGLLQTSTAMNEVGYAIGYWSMVIGDGERVAVIEAQMANATRRLTRRNYFTYACGIVSLIAFLVGVTIAGQQLKT